MLPKQSRIPNALSEALSNKRGLEAMVPGESTWTVPWALTNDAGHLHLRPGMIDRSKTPGGKITLKVFKDFEGIVVDATAVPEKDLEDYLTRESSETVILGGSKEEPRLVDLILLPPFSETGNDPATIRAINAEQTALIRQFQDHHQAAYGQPYVLAAQEVNRHSY